MLLSHDTDLAEASLWGNLLRLEGRRCQRSITLVFLRRATSRIRRANVTRLRIAVVDEGFIGSLHTAVGLNRAGCSVLLLGAVGGRSSYRGEGFSAVTCPPPTHADFLPAVRTLIGDFNADIVYPATEPTHLFLRPDVPLPDKREAVELACAAGLRVPSETCRPPAVVKGTTGRGGDAVVIAHSEAELRHAVARIESASRSVQLQEFIRGTTYLFGGLFFEGEPLRLYAWRKVRQYPRLTGPATIIRSDYDEELIEAGMRFFRQLRWTGLASTDFIRASDGTLFFLEVNPRPWGSIAAARDAGVDLFTPMAQLLGGEVPKPDLAFEHGIVTHVFPLYLLEANPLFWPRMFRDIRRDGFWSDLRLTQHILYRLRRVRANWPKIFPRH